MYAFRDVGCDVSSCDFEYAEFPRPRRRPRPRFPEAFGFEPPLPLPRPFPRPPRFPLTRPNLQGGARLVISRPQLELGAPRIRAAAVEPFRDLLDQLAVER